MKFERFPVVQDYSFTMLCEFANGFCQRSQQMESIDILRSFLPYRIGC